MEASKTKEEIFKKFFHPVTEEDVRLKRSIFDFADEYANQLLLEKDKEIEKINKSADYWVKKHDEIILINSNLQSELSELKEKRNDEIIKAFNDGKRADIYTRQDWEDGKEYTNTTGEQYYTQTYGQSTEQPKSDPQDMGLIQ